MVKDQEKDKPPDSKAEKRALEHVRRFKDEEGTKEGDNQFNKSIIIIHNDDDDDDDNHIENNSSSRTKRDIQSSSFTESSMNSTDDETKFDSLHRRFKKHRTLEDELSQSQSQQKQKQKQFSKQPQYTNSKETTTAIDDANHKNSPDSTQKKKKTRTPVGVQVPPPPPKAVLHQWYGMKPRRIALTVRKKTKERIHIHVVACYSVFNTHIM